jgi:hypothetical protein
MPVVVWIVGSIWAAVFVMATAILLGATVDLMSSLFAP